MALRKRISLVYHRSKVTPEEFPCNNLNTRCYRLEVYLHPFRDFRRSQWQTIEEMILSVIGNIPSID